MLSGRMKWDAATNRLSVARASRVRSGAEILDLTNSNPTTAGIDYPLDELAEAMGRAARARYEPEPLGIRGARATLAAELRCHPDDLVLTASTSEAYSYLFKLLADPDDEIVVGVPSYPLVEHLAALELVRVRTFPLEFQTRWHLHAERALQAASQRTRAILVVNPNNPTGSYVRSHEQDQLVALGLPLISDEVFYDFPIEVPLGPSFSRSDTLTFTLGGLSKSAGLPHYKLAWIRVNGPEQSRRQALRALELIADNFLSVATPVQAALDDLLHLAPGIREKIRARCRTNLDALRAEISPLGSMTALPVEGGWSAILRVPKLESDEDLAIRLLESQGVVVHPGYFFDFESDGHLVVSLLTEPEVLIEGVRRMISIIAA